jgi:hypothetical protein
MIRRLFGPSARQLLDMAIARAAKLKGEVEEAGVRVHFYAVLVQDMDPEADWWRYAELRQKLEDARMDHLELFKYAVEAEGQVKSLIADGVVP